mmetsp:Transcript_5385/g.9300  ORF Transcript_5385/g.9300 Transcript_5385/m.9300 type:complete len:207 (-) Transcript_5385:588-1208(-)
MDYAQLQSCPLCSTVRLPTANAVIYHQQGRGNDTNKSGSDSGRGPHVMMRSRGAVGGVDESGGGTWTGLDCSGYMSSAGPQILHGLSWGGVALCPPFLVLAVTTVPDLHLLCQLLCHARAPSTIPNLALVTLNPELVLFVVLSAQGAGITLAICPASTVIIIIILLVVLVLCRRPFPSIVFTRCRVVFLDAWCLLLLQPRLCWLGL